MARFKLANVLLQVEDFLAEAPEVFYRCENGASCAYDEETGALEIAGLVDFATYFNGVSMGKWQRYTGVRDVFLHVEIAGDASTIAVRSLSEDAAGATVTDVVDVVEIEAHPDFRSVELSMPTDAVIAGFAVMTDGAVRIRNAYYYAEVADERIRPVRLALCTTTFRKEDFIVPNIARIKEGVFGCDDPIADNFHMFVVDNGRTLNVDELSDEHVTVIPNPNVGGAGGFARGMMAAQDDARGFTHVILMDDDVRMSVESFKRTFALLSLVTEEYVEACLNGAMVELERPWLQYEDVAYVRRVGGYDRIKKDMRIDSMHDIVRNELIDIEANDRTYGAWWYSCIPMSLIERHGLPVPFFVRCDDVEYGVRLNTKYMALGGICVWHAGFDIRFNAAVACFQYVRNMMAMMAMHDDLFTQDVFMVRFWRTFHYLLRTMDYDAAELWLDGMEAYFKGPEALMQVNGAELLRENNSRCEKLVPVDELDQATMSQLEYDVDWLMKPEGFTVSAIRKAMLTVPHDRHWFPDFMLRDNPNALATGFANFTPWWRTAMRKRLVAMNSDATSGHVRELDRARYKQLHDRFGQLMQRYRRENDAVIAEWRASLPTFASREFWADYIAAR